MQNLTIIGEEIIDKNQSPKLKKFIAEKDLIITLVIFSQTFVPAI